ncbi:fibrinogen C domain-containing protein 1-like [Mytilus californianus]|uniref:fibrinogen C domain-containing protein 1-like n=1 Tax=Mytilus californianus TaxID=6549 RepID=UPI0022471C1F|nr:fibrinogen C domain-containing protein 1-like [Mytilus californianus]
MIFAALFTVVCLFGKAKLHTNSSRHHCVESSCHTGVCFYGEAAERILVLAKTDWDPKCHRGRPRDCNDIPDWCPNGVYKVYPRHSTGFEVYCEMKIDGGHWTVFQRRENGYVDFLRGWNDYKHGFGYLKHEFWLGNTKMHFLTSHGQYEMRIDLTDFEGNHAFAKYKDFKIGAESSKFKLTANGYYGTAGNSLEHHNGISFSTRDNDNDNASSGNCSTWFPGGWWYNRCMTANLNGVYFIRTPAMEHRGVYWRTWKGINYSLKISVMMLRRL